MSLFGFVGGVGSAIGRAVAKKMKSGSLNQVKDDFQRNFLDGRGSVGDQAEAIARVVLVGHADLSFQGFLDAIFSNTQWYEWALILLVIAAQILAIILTGGASIALQLVGVLANAALFGVAIDQVIKDCEGVNSIGCNSKMFETCRL